MVYEENGWKRKIYISKRKAKGKRTTSWENLENGCRSEVNGVVTTNKIYICERFRLGAFYWDFISGNLFFLFTHSSFYLVVRVKWCSIFASILRFVCIFYLAFVQISLSFCSMLFELWNVIKQVKKPFYNSIFWWEFDSELLFMLLSSFFQKIVRLLNLDSPLIISSLFISRLFQCNKFVSKCLWMHVHTTCFQKKTKYSPSALIIAVLQHFGLITYRKWFIKCQIEIMSECVK